MAQYIWTQTCSLTGETLDVHLTQEEREDIESQPGFLGWEPGEIVEVFCACVWCGDRVADDSVDFCSRDCADQFSGVSDSGPPIGTWAATARAMSDLYPDFDWDSWKDEMKESY